MAKPDQPIRIWIKPKVIAGFVVILAFAIASIVITYNGFIELSKTSQNLSQPNKKLVTLNAILTDIYEAESSIRTYTLLKEEKYFDAYLKFLLTINSRVDSLTALAQSTPPQIKRVLQIKTLLDQKRRVLSELVMLKKSDRTSKFYDAALEEISRAKQSNQINKPIVSRSTVTTISRKDTVVTKPSPDRSGFLNRIRAWFVGQEKVDSTLTRVQVETSIDTLLKAGYVHDTVFIGVLETLNRIRAEQENYKNLISAKELELLSSDKRIMDQIRSIVSMLEREEITRSFQRASDAEDVVSRSTIIVLSLGSIALVLLILFLAVIFRDISKSTYYRNQLFEAKKYAEKLLRVKEQFLANMSHEIRTPLSSIIGITRQLGRTELDAQQQEYVSALSTSSEHLLSVINDILDYSKLEAGQLKIENIPFNPAQIFTEIIDSMRVKAVEKAIGLSLKIDGNIPLTLWGDPFRLRQIVLNLLSNAIKFTGKGGVIVDVFVDKIDEGSISLAITVSDTGIGIPPEQQSLIFEEFTQADPQITRRFGGTGLGLTIVKRLTELQGGALQLDSVPNEGTRVTVTIPYRLTGVQPEAKDLRDKYVLPPGIRILVVDDDEINRTITVEMAKSLGVLVDSTGKPRVALDMIQANSYNVILTDIQMPEISGYDLVKLIDQQNKSLPVIAITANSLIDDPAHFIDRGFAGHLIKPFDEGDLFNAIAPLVGVAKVKLKRSLLAKDDRTLFDLSDIMRFAGGDIGSVRLILSTFIDNTRMNLDELNRQVKAKDLQRASAIAHRMKSGFNQFKIYHIANLLLKIERLGGSTGKQRTAQILLNELNSQIKPVIKELSKELEGLSRH